MTGPCLRRVWLVRLDSRPATCPAIFSFYSCCYSQSILQCWNFPTIKTLLKYHNFVSHKSMGVILYSLHKTEARLLRMVVLNQTFRGDSTNHATEKLLLDTSHCLRHNSEAFWGPLVHNTQSLTMYWSLVERI